MTSGFVRSILKNGKAYSFIMIGKGVVLISNSIFIGKDLNIGDNDLAYLCEYVKKDHQFLQMDDRSKQFVWGFKDGNINCLETAYGYIVPNLGCDFAIAVVPPSKIYKNFNTKTVFST